MTATYRRRNMKATAKIICFGVALAWLPAAMAAGIVVSDQGGTIVLESVAAPADAAQVQPQPASAPASVPVQALPDQGGSSAARVPVQPYYNKVDRASIEKRMADRAARAQKRKADAEKDAAGRAAQVQQMNQQQGQGARGSP
jgi:hypothetical protein